MRIRRLTGLSLGVLAAVAISVAGCGNHSATPGTPTPQSSSAPASSAAADPAATAALGQATAALGTTSFKTTLTAGPGVKLLASVDAPNSKGTATLTIAGPNAKLEVSTLLVGQDLYLRVPGITKTDTWTHVDVARLPEGANVGLRPGQIDPANTAKLLASTTDVRQVDSRSYQGTLDLTKVAGITGVDKVNVDGWGAAAQNVPFTAGLDDQGRLSALTIQLPAVKGQQSQPLEVLYTDYGAIVDAQRPTAAEITEAPDSLYTSLGR
jgi:hypothetical protein